MSADNDDHEFQTVVLRDGESPDKIGHAHGKLQQYEIADGAGVEVPAEDRREAQIGTLREVSDGADFLADVCDDLRGDLDADVDAPLADCGIALTDIAAVLDELADGLAEDADGDELAERLHEVMHS